MAKQYIIKKCVKCGEEFKSEVDKMGKAYNSLCKKHRKMTESEAHAEDMHKLSMACKKIVARTRSKLDNNVYFENGQWVGYVVNLISFSHKEICRGVDEEKVVQLRKKYLTENTK